MNKSLNTKTGVRGWTETRLFDRNKLTDSLISLGFNAEQYRNDFRDLVIYSNKVLGEEKTRELVESCAKPLFSPNFIWKIIKKLFKADIQSFLTGRWTTEAIVNNTITNAGLNVAAEQVGGTTTAPVTAIALGTGTGQTATSTTLATEISTSGGSRGAATVSNETGDTAGDTERWIKTFTITGTLAITEEGLFDNNTSGGNMLAVQSFSAVNVINGDSLQVTHNVKFARAA